MSKRRSLRPDERDIWAKVTKSVRPLNARFGDFEPDFPMMESASVPLVLSTDIKALQKPAVLGTRDRRVSIDVMVSTVSDGARKARRMDAKTHLAMQRGKLSPEAKLDLHGRTLDQAHDILVRFVTKAHLENLRLLLVITGKGKNVRRDAGLVHEGGVLRHYVPRWLAAAPLAQIVLEITQSHIRHGGDGAFYVYLRRHREVNAR